MPRNRILGTYTEMRFAYRQKCTLHFGILCVCSKIAWQQKELCVFRAQLRLRAFLFFHKGGTWRMKKKHLLLVVALIMAFCFSGCGGSKPDANTLKKHGYWYSTQVPDNRGGKGQLQIMFNDDKTCSVYFENSGGWLSGGECSVSVSSSQIVLKSTDGDIIHSPLANNGSYSIQYQYNKDTDTLSMLFGDVKLFEGIAPFCVNMLLK